VVSALDPTAVNLGSLDPEPLLFHSSSSSVILEAEWTPFQSHYFSEDLVAPGIEPGTSGYVARNSKPQRRSFFSNTFAKYIPVNYYLSHVQLAF
jgi:hypothetical protein